MLSQERAARVAAAALLAALVIAAGTAFAGTPAARFSYGLVLAASAVDPPSPAPAAAVVLPTPAGTTDRVSVGSDGNQGNDAAGGASAILSAAKPSHAISADGRWVAFVSAATNLIPGSPQAAGGVYLRDRQSGTTVAVPWLDGGAHPAGVTGAEPAISAEGGVVAFTVVNTSGISRRVLLSTSTPYVLAWDRLSNTTQVVSLDANGGPTPGWQPSISADGRYVAYTLWAPGDTTPPNLSNASANPTCIDNVTTSSTISVTATDPDDAVAGVTLYYQPPGQFFTSVQMVNVSGNLWQGTISKDITWGAGGQVGYSMVAVDSHGNQSAALPDDPQSANNRLVYQPSGCVIL